MKPVHSLSQFLYNLLYIILPYTCRSTKWSISFTLFHQNSKWYINYPKGKEKSAKII